MAITKEEIDQIIYHEKRAIPKYPYWYGMKRALYESIGLSNKYPAACHLEHGAAMIYRNNTVHPFVLKNPYPVIFLSNQWQKDYCLKYAGDKITKPMHVIGSIFPRYRKYKNIIPKGNRRGSLVFLGHSTKFVEYSDNWDDLIVSLKELPECYHPLTISIYFIDFLKGIHKKFERAGFDVITAGHIADPYFVDNFYNHMRNYKYVIGTGHGSHLYYAVEMGIPYMVYEPRGQYNSSGKDSYAPKGEVDVKDFSFLKQVISLFTYTREEIQRGIEIKEEQRQFVESRIGINDAISSQKIREILMSKMGQFLLKETFLFPIRFCLREFRNMKARQNYDKSSPNL